MLLLTLPIMFSLLSLTSSFQLPMLLNTDHISTDAQSYQAASDIFLQRENLKNLGQTAQGGFEIYLTECLPQPANSITCHFVARNTQDMRELEFRPQSSRMIDGSGTEVMGSYGRFGSDSIGSGCYCTADVSMPKNVRVNGEVTFETNPSNDQISYMQIDFIDFMVDFTFIEE